MKRLFSIILIAVAAMTAGSEKAHAASGDLFPYPTAPDTMLLLQPRCDYIVNRFWDRCNFDQAFRTPDKFNRAFGDFVNILPHASADTVHAAVDALIARFAKSGPRTLQLAEMAENWLYSDTAQIFSEEIYLPFARAAAAHKKISKADKARFALHKSVIEASGLGATMPDIEFVRRDGSKGSLHGVKNGSILIFINDPDCMDCTIARIKLSSDPNTRELIAAGQLAIVSILPDEPTDEWKNTSYPDEWTVGAVADADSYFDLRSSPQFIYLDSKYKVLAKDLDLDYLMGAFRVANANRKK